MSDEESIGKRFADKVVAQDQGLGPAFVDKVEEKQATEPGFVDETLKAVRGRAGTATETIGATLSRLSTAVAETASDVAASIGVAAPAAGSLQAAISGIRAKDVSVPGAELIIIDRNDKVGDLEKLLRAEKIHSVPVHDPARKTFIGVVDTADLITWAASNFSHEQLNAWATFSQENEFKLQPVMAVMNSSWRDHFVVVSPELEALEVLQKFRDPKVHRIFLQPPNNADSPLTGVITQTDIVRFLHQTTFESKAVRIGEKIQAKKVVSCFEGELAVSAFRLMDHASVSAVAVVDSKGKLVGAVSSFDVTSGPQESLLNVLFSSLSTFLKREKANEAKAVISCHANDTFSTVLKLMFENHVSHVFIVDDDSFPTGVVTAGDLINAIFEK